VTTNIAILALVAFLEIAGCFAFASRTIDSAPSTESGGQRRRYGGSHPRESRSCQTTESAGPCLGIEACY
jgi:hypothetical protein